MSLHIIFLFFLQNGMDFTVKLSMLPPKVLMIFLKKNEHFHEAWICGFKDFKQNVNVFAREEYL